MKYRYFQWGVAMALLVSVIITINTDVKKRELNQRYEKLIEQDEKQHQAHFNEREKQFWTHSNEREEWHAERKKRHQEYIKEIKGAIKRISN